MDAELERWQYQSDTEERMIAFVSLIQYVTSKLTIHMLCRCPWMSSCSREIRLHTGCVRSPTKKKQVIFLLSTICKTLYFHDSIHMHNYEKNHTKTYRSSFIHICQT